jgi:sterol 14alpha-demethylase
MSTTSATISKLRKTPPELRGGMPYLGHAFEFARDPIGLLQRGRDEFGEIFSFLLAGQQVTVLTGPKGNEVFLRSPDSQLSVKEAYQLMVPILGKGIAYDVSPEVMNEQMGFILPALRKERLQTYAQFMFQEALEYFEQWGDSGEIDLFFATGELTTFIAGRCLIGEEFRSHLTTEFPRLYKDLDGGLNLLAFFQPYLPLPAFKRRDRARARLGELVSQIIAHRHQQRIEGEDFLETLMAARYSDGTALSEDNITGLLLTVLFSGQHTCAALAAWTGILLLQHPDYLTDILQEQQTIFRGEKEISLEQLNQLVVLERAIQEAERMRPPLIMLTRKILQDFEYKGYHISAGGLAMVSPPVSHRIQEIFRNPDQYDPERFAPGREEHRKSQYALVGFGGGTHRCIGQTFAYQQLKVIWSILLQHFDLELVQENYEPNYGCWVVGPKQPCLLRYRRKHKF